MSIITVAIGSKNPAKIDAVRRGFLAVWPEKEFNFVGVNASSGVSDQPMSDTESVQGARNRANRVLAEVADAQFGVGLEGGLHYDHGTHFDSQWIIIRDRAGREGIASSVRIPTAPKLVEMIKEGKELGQAIDIVFKRENAKQAEGYVGLITNNLLTRAQISRDAVILALARFVHLDLF